MLRRLASQRLDIVSPTQDIPQGEHRWKLQGQGDSFTGDDITPETARGVPAVLGCITVLTEDGGSLPWFLYRRLKRGREQATDHPLFARLHDSPNPEMTSMSYREIIIGHVAGWGNSYSQKIFDKAGRVAELWPLNPSRMIVVRDKGMKKYLYRLIEGGQKAFTQQDILHIPGFGYDGLIGYSKIELARQAIAIMVATEKFVGTFFANDARPGIVLEYPGKLTQKAIDNVIASWNLSYQGAGKRSKVAVAEEGLKIHEIGISQEDNQFVQVKEFGLTEVCRIFRMPPHKVQHLANATFSNIEHQGIEYVTDTLRPWLVRIEQNVNLQLLTAEERVLYYNEILVDGLLRGDTSARIAYYASGRQWGWLSANDVREKENANPIDGGDEYLVPLNMVPAGQSSAPAPNQGNSAGGSRSLDLPFDQYISRQRMVRAKNSVTIRRRLMLAQRPVIKDVAARVLRREIHDVKEAAGKFLKRSAAITGSHGRRDEKSFDAWLTTFYQEHQDFIRKQFAPIMNSYGQLVAGAAGDEVGADGWTAETEQFVRAYINSYALRHANISAADIRGLVTTALAAEGDPVEALDGVLGDWVNTRSDEIVMNESVRENNAVAKAIYMAAGFSEIVWVTNASAKINCNYCSALDGKVSSVTENFINAGQDFQPEGATSPLTPSGNVGHPPAHKGCECLIAAWN